MHLPDPTSLHWVQLLSSSLLVRTESSCKCIALEQSFSSRSTLAFLPQMSWDFHHSSPTTAFCLVQLPVLGKRIGDSFSAHLLSCGLFPFSSTGVHSSHILFQHPSKHCHSYKSAAVRLPVTPPPGGWGNPEHLTAQDVAVV